ncbi:efflux RND transporter periplasmic adaptor subunit [Niveispirillum sp. KHB5.9]|uniref:efflux RND transporter periplasmic adaptor subunit n=1 Tax=Niveispirillum sp. KHB5.9 TaxID=3400269 RepID=UPI003A8BC99E
MLRAPLSMLLLVTLAGCGKPATDTAQAAPTAAPVPVSVSAARPAPEARMVKATGTVAFKREIPLSFKVAGKVEGFQVDIADPVTRGQRLARIQGTEVDAQLRAADARVTKARQDLDRLLPLVANGYVEKARVDAARSALDTAQADRDAIAFNRGLSEIAAPADGVVLARPLEPGQIVQSGTTALIIGDRESGVIVRAGLSDRDVARIATGNIAELDLPEGKLEGKVTRIAAKSATGTGVFDVEVTLPDAPTYLSSGRIVTLHIAPRPGGEKPPLAVPASSIIEGFGDLATLYVVKPDGKSVERRQVKVAGLRGPDLLVASGLNEGERVVSAGGAYLRPDSAISVARPGA